MNQRSIEILVRGQAVCFRHQQQLQRGDGQAEFSWRYEVGFPSAMVRKNDAHISLARAGEAEEAAGSVYLLCLPEAVYIAEQILIYDGGRL